MMLWKKFRESRLGEVLRGLFTQREVNYFKHLPLAILAAIVYRFPARKLKIIGVTGTDGKTTTVNLIYEILSRAGLKAAMVSTVFAKFGSEKIDTGFHVTSPNPWLLQKFLRTVVDKKVGFLILEVTSHGLDQFRFWGIPFEIGVVTNVTPEHLDYHKTYENYLAAKGKLFENVKVAVLNEDDKSFAYLNTEVLKNKQVKIITYGIRSEADFTVKKYEFKTNLPGEYNLYNCLAAIATVSQLSIDKKMIKETLATFKGVTGRMEEIKGGQEFKVIVDFAHTPNALEQVLKTVKSGQHAISDKQGGKVIVVFGSAGLRDKSKRPMMGEIAVKLADLVVLTAEDPRTEDVNDIINQISLGCVKSGGVEGKNFYKVPDRQGAINFAVQKLAKKNDVVIICGKGHEKSMCFGHVEHPWSDQEAVRKAIKGRYHG